MKTSAAGSREEQEMESDHNFHPAAAQDEEPSAPRFPPGWRRPSSPNKNRATIICISFPCHSRSIAPPLLLSPTFLNTLPQP